MAILKIKDQNGEWQEIPAIKGKDGVSITDANIDDDNNLIITLSDGNVINAGYISLGNQSPAFMVNLTHTDDGIIADYTYDAIKTAIDSGTNVYARFPDPLWKLDGILFPLIEERNDVICFGAYVKSWDMEYLPESLPSFIWLCCNKDNEWHYDNNYLIDFPTFCEATDNKANKVKVWYEYEPTYTFKFDNVEGCKIIMLEDASNISFVFGNNQYYDGYASALSFKSGDTPTAIDYTGTGILNWVGTDCSIVDGKSIFQPSANTHYDIVFDFNGTQFVGVAIGYKSASINVPVPEDGNVVSE